MQRHELEAWLGDDWTPEQVDTIAERYERLVREYRIADPDEQQALLVAGAQQVDGTLDPDEIVQTDLIAARRAVEARRALRALVRLEVADGMSESEAHRRYGINRLTVRAWLGKE